ncbi:hypothetical protein F3Y22_tig00001799pilonHSYRG00008 [Hibiscus syriacus]|uniref:PAS domain-containing protein n=1 Tax=Hibiscus syriacus TaxID=106335 RepID=A0A6A3CUD8_HIBSY|nr:hypothetical protein F3Y22_tig00001799pilonHSYRG00008 [Hibiscus syriacus]
MNKPYDYSVTLHSSYSEEEKNVELKLEKFGRHYRQDITSEKVVMDKFIHLHGDYRAIIQSLSPLIPPIFASDEIACCSEWNAAMESLTGWSRSEVIAISVNQKQFLETSDACERQILAIIENMDLGSIEEGYASILFPDLHSSLYITSHFFLRLIRNSRYYLYGDQIRLQLVLSDFLLNVVHHAPSPDGCVEIKASTGLKLIQDGSEFVRLQFRMVHPGKVLPSSLIQDMLDGGNQSTTREGKLLNKMKGDVHYVREHRKCYFPIVIKIRTRKAKGIKPE